MSDRVLGGGCEHHSLNSLGYRIAVLKDISEPQSYKIAWRGYGRFIELERISSIKFNNLELANDY